MGRIIAPYGVKGWVKIHPFGDDPLSWRGMSNWWLAPSDDAPEAVWRVYRLRGLRAQGSAWVAAFADVEDRSSAEALEGFFIAAPREALPDLEPGTYYWGDLVGMEVRSLSGEVFGRVVGLLETGAHDVLQVQDTQENKTPARLIPFVDAFVKTVSHEDRVIVVDWQKDW